MPDPQRPRRGMTVFGTVLALLLIGALALFASVEPGGPASGPSGEASSGSQSFSSASFLTVNVQWSSDSLTPTSS